MIVIVPILNLPKHQRWKILSQLDCRDRISESFERLDQMITVAHMRVSEPSVFYLWKLNGKQTSIENSTIL